MVYPGCIQEYIPREAYQAIYTQGGILGYTPYVHPVVYPFSLCTPLCTLFGTHRVYLPRVYLPQGVPKEEGYFCAEWSLFSHG